MQKLSKPKGTAIVLILISFVSNCFIFKNLFSLAILIVTIFMLVYFNGYYRYSFFKNHRGNVKLEIRSLYNIIPVYDVKFINKDKIEKTDYIIVFSIMPIILFSLFFSIYQFDNLLLKYKIINITASQSVKYTIYVSVILLFIFFSEDLVRIIKLIFNYHVLFIEVRNFKVESVVENNDCKFHHRNIFLMENDYKDYSLKDLKREKIYLAGKLEKAKKPAFYDVYILPLIVLFVSGVLSIISAYINTFMFNKGTENNLNGAIKSYTLFAFILLLAVFFTSFMIRKVSYDTIGNLMSRILVIEELVIKREK